nr:G patch domain-containing protein 4 [Osmia lignaria]
MNDFAKSQLLKYGWSEGKGLGKHENGITEALKPKLKFDTTGVGHQVNNWNNWWETAFNKAANNIKVDSQVHDISISVSKENTTNNLSKDLNKKQFQSPINYGNFLKTSTLLNGNLITENNSNASKVEDVTHVSLTDEELFKICGGRTAHKGARHGLTLNGKLNRIAQQEKDLLNINAYRNMVEKLENNNNKSQSNEYEIDNNNEITLLPPHLVTEELIVPNMSKTARRNNRRRINNLTHRLNVLCNVSDNNDEKGKEVKTEEKEKSKKCKRKKKRSSVSDDIESTEIDGTDNVTDDLSLAVSKKLGKKMKRKIQEQTNDYHRNNFNDELKHKKKKKRSKKKNQDYQFKCISDTCEDEEMDGFKAKKLKKSEKSYSTSQLFYFTDEDISTLECKFHTKLSRDETSAQSDQTRDSGMCVSERISNLSHVYLKHKANQLNARIKKRKKLKLLKKQKKKLNKITESLKAVHFDTKESTEGESSNSKVEAIVENIMAPNIAVDKTELLKKKKKKHNK